LIITKGVNPKIKQRLRFAGFIGLEDFNPAFSEILQSYKS